MFENGIDTIPVAAKNTRINYPQNAPAPIE
jgi:hypothetical protein